MLARITLGLAALAAQAVAIPTITAKGAKFFTSDGNQFYMKGIAYQITNDDPLVDATQCQMDADLMSTIGANSIRVYHVDPTANHDACMNIFASKGIYLFVDLDTFSTTVVANTPAWTQSQYNAFAAVMDAFAPYDNTAGFFVGNEVLTSGANSIAAPYVKAAAVDMKKYRDSKNYRKIPVGYSAADIPTLRPNLQNYLACGSNADDALDFYSLNAYEWCGQATYQSSGYVGLQAMAANYSIPIFFSETGCIVPPPRYWGDQSAILGPEMDGTWSGAIIYEWIMEANDYGIVSYGPPSPTGIAISGTPTPINPDFENLSNVWKTLSPTGVAMAAYTPSLPAPSCPAYTAVSWLISGDVPLPTLGAAAAGSVPAGTTSPASSYAIPTGSSSTGAGSTGSTGANSGSSTSSESTSSSGLSSSSEPASSSGSSSSSGSTASSSALTSSSDSGNAKATNPSGSSATPKPTGNAAAGRSALLATSSSGMGAVWYLGSALASALFVVACL